MDNATVKLDLNAFDSSIPVGTMGTVECYVSEFGGIRVCDPDTGADYDVADFDDATQALVYEAFIDPVIEVGSDTGRALRAKRSPDMARLHTDDLTGDVRAYGLTARGTEVHRKASQEPSSALANSMNDPDIMSLYNATPKEAEIAQRARTYAYGLDAKGRPKSPKSRKPKQTRAEKAAAILARRNK